MVTDAIQNLKSKNKKCFYIGVTMFLFIVLLVIYTVSLGAMNIGFFKASKIIFAKLTANANILSLFKPNEVAIVWDIRLPRIICGVFVGMGLSVAGVVFQSLLRNPLADPYTIGVSTGAAFGASLAILLNISFGIYIPPTISAFLSAGITLIAVIYISNKSGEISSSSLIISGIIVSSILSSGMSFIKMIAGENVSAIVFWLMGSLSSRNWHNVIIVVPIVVICTLICFFFANDLNVMTIGEKTASSLGVNTKAIRIIYLVLGSVITAVCVSVSGIIGFIGLVVPHILRHRLTPNNRILIPLCALLGGIILSVADNITRLFFVSEIPVGVLTTLIGGPFFIYVFSKKRGK